MQKQFLPRWLKNRLQQNGLRTNQAGIDLLIELNEGNLLALAQAIEKLCLLYNETTVTTEQISTAISDNAKFDVFKFVDGLLTGDKNHSLRILQGLKAEASEPTILIWAIARELRSLIKMRQDMEQGFSIEQAMDKQRVWGKRKPLVASTLRRHTLKTLQNSLSQCATIDRVIKGTASGNYWDDIENLALVLS